MEWVLKYYDDDTTTWESILNQYRINNNLTNQQYLDVLTHGINPQNLAPLVSEYFNLEPFSSTSMISAIDNGWPMMGTIPNSTNPGFHEVMITGYYNDGQIEYFDPELGMYQKADPSIFSIVISSKK